jgi:hypothetical protein
MNSTITQIIKPSFATALIAGPVAVAAASTPTTYADLVSLIIDFINILIPAMFAILFVVLMWQIFDAWIIHAGEPQKREEGRRKAIIAVIVLVVAISFLGIVQIIRTSFIGT